MAKDETPGDKPATINAILTFTDAGDAERFMQAYHDGKLAELGITNVHPTTPEERAGRNWTTVAHRPKPSPQDRTPE